MENENKWFLSEKALRRVMVLGDIYREVTNKEPQQKKSYTRRKCKEEKLRRCDWEGKEKQISHLCVRIIQPFYVAVETLWLNIQFCESTLWWVIIQSAQLSFLTDLHFYSFQASASDVIDLRDCYAFGGKFVCSVTCCSFVEF